MPRGAQKGQLIKKRRKGKKGRKCNLCGKPAWPNYFFCHKCHSTISDKQETCYEFHGNEKWMPSLSLDNSYGFSNLEKAKE